METGWSLAIELVLVAGSLMTFKISCFAHGTKEHQQEGEVSNALARFQRGFTLYSACFSVR